MQQMHQVIISSRNDIRLGKSKIYIQEQIKTLLYWKGDIGKPFFINPKSLLCIIHRPKIWDKFQTRTFSLERKFLKNNLL